MKSIMEPRNGGVGKGYFSKSDFKVRFKHVFFMKPPGSAARSGPGTAQPMLIRVVIMVMIDSGNKIDTETSIF